MSYVDAFHNKDKDIVHVVERVNPSYANIAYPYSTNLAGDPMGPFQSIKSKNTGALVRAVRCIDNDCAFVGSPTFGCNDPIAENYDPTVGVNDNSCVYIMGCTDPNSWLRSARGSVSFSNSN